MLDPLLRASLRHTIIEVLASSDNVSSPVGTLADELTDKIAGLWDAICGANLQAIDPEKLLADIASHIDSVRGPALVAKDVPFLAAPDTEDAA